MLLRALGIVVVASLLAGCNSEKIIDGEAATVIVYGRVSAANGAVAPRALMSLTAHVQGACANPIMDAVNAVTNTAGDYRAALFNWGTQFTVCVSVNAAPAVGSGFLSRSVQRAPVVMRSGSPDSIRVDLELQPDS